MGATDFDKRGAGLLQYSGFTGRRMQRPMRSEYHQRKIDDLQSRFNQLPMEHTRNPDGSITSRGSGNFIGGELFRPGQPLTERQYNAVNFARMAANVKYNDEVLRSYAMYEEQQGSTSPEVIVINKNTTVPVKVGSNLGMMIGSGSNSGSSEESYASYQGH